jgi:hypothetical protein
MTTSSLTIGDLSDRFLDVVMREFVDYSVAIARVRDDKAETFQPLGTGVLIRRKNRFGILTARHCLHAFRPEVQIGASGRDTLSLVLRGGRSLVVRPSEAFEHPLVMPRSEEFGPDLTFVEILPGERLSSLGAIGSFWSLDQDPDKITEDFGKVGTAVASIGFPCCDYRTEITGNDIHHTLRHMAFLGAIGEGSVVIHDGWDYLESTVDYTGKGELPQSFGGVSGGPVWGMQLKKVKDDSFEITQSALVGISFYQTALVDKKRSVRSHFINSIYKLAWESFP